MARNSDNFSETANLSENVAKFESKTPEQIKSVVDDLATKENPPKTPTKANENGFLYKDNAGQNHFIRKEVADEWMREFGLKSVDESFTAQIPQEISEILGKDIRLNVGSLLKITAKNRQKYIKNIKPTFAEPDIVLKDGDGVLFIKEMGDKKVFVNVNVDKGEYFVSISQAPKRTKSVENKIKNGAEVLYNRFANFESNSPHKTFTDLTSQANQSDSVNSSTNLAQSQGLDEISKIHSGSEIGGGLFGGTINGIETDENGDIVGFNPSKFLQGFAVGAGGTFAARKGLKFLQNHPEFKQAQIYPNIALKNRPELKIYQNPAAQKYALKQISNIQRKFGDLSTQNPLLFAKIMQKFEPRDFLRQAKDIKKLSEEIFNKELLNAIKSAIKQDEILPMPKSQFRNFREFKKNFDSADRIRGTINTPLGEISVKLFYAWEHFTKNTNNTNRESIKGGFFDTFKDPLFVVKFTPDGKDRPSTYFYKPFYKKYGESVIWHLFGIGVDDDGILDFATYYLDKKGSRLQQILKNKDAEIKYIKK